MDQVEHLEKLVNTVHRHNVNPIELQIAIAQRTKQKMKFIEKQIDCLNPKDPDHQVKLKELNTKIKRSVDFLKDLSMIVTPVIRNDIEDIRRYNCE